MSEHDYKIIDAVVNIWTAEALSHRPGWTDEFFVGKVKGKHGSGGISLEKMLEDMDAANIEMGFLVAAKAGRVGLPGCYHMPLEVVADACAKYPKRFKGLVGTISGSKANNCQMRTHGLGHQFCLCKGGGHVGIGVSDDQKILFLRHVLGSFIQAIARCKRNAQVLPYP